MTAVTLFFVGCSKQAGLTEEQTEFFNVMGEKIAYMKPDTTVVVAKCNKFEITNHDIMQNVFQGMRGDVQILDSAEPDRIDAFLRQIINIKGQQELLLTEARSVGISVPKDTVDAFIEANFYVPNDGKDAFMEMLKAQGLSMDFVREDTENNLLLLKYIEEVALAGSDDVVTDDEIAKAYEDNKATYQQETASVRHILFLTQGKSDEEKADIQAMAESVLKEAENGADFAELAGQYSEDPGSKNTGGLYQDFTRGKMVQPFEDASFNTKPGTIVDHLVETSYGFHIIKVEDHKSGKALAEVKEEIRSQLLEQKKQDAFPPIMNKLMETYEFEVVI